MIQGSRYYTPLNKDMLSYDTIEYVREIVSEKSNPWIRILVMSC